jgi:hypothetical protein
VLEKTKTGKVRLSRHRVTTVAVEKQQVFTYSECASVVFVIQYTKRMRRIILLYLPHDLIHGTTFGKKKKLF